LTNRTTRVDPGERIAIVGYPEGGPLSISTGVAVEYAPSPDPEDPVEILKATTIVKPGNSGGPALDDQGRVVGVVFAEELAVDELLIIPIDTVMGIAPADFRAEPDCRTLER
jgi:S1-C subfamily serine protease